MIFGAQNKAVLGIFPGFVLHVVLNGTTVEFEPSVSSFEIVVLNAFDKILEAVSSVPRVETKLYPNESEHASKPNLKPIIAKEFIEGAKTQVCSYNNRLVMCVTSEINNFMCLDNIQLCVYNFNSLK